MRTSFESFTVRKRFPLTISRGTSTENTNIWLRLAEDGIEGWGEAVPFSIGEKCQTAPMLLASLQQAAGELEKFHPWQRQQIESTLAPSLPSAAWAAIDIALHDWIGKRLGVPLWQMWGLERSRIVPISGTIGISPPDVAQKRLEDWRQITGALILKLKMGNPAGIEADKEMLLAVKAAAPNAQLSVDANGGWSLAEAIAMSEWLETVGGVKYIEQPLAAGAEADLVKLYDRSPLSIFADESCFNSADIPQLSDRVHGINIKMMRCGGLTEAWRMANVAQACGLQIMFGCYSDSTLTNTAAAQLSPLANHLDLDSHLNLLDDPFSGAIIESGRLIPNHSPGNGVKRKA